MQPPKTNVATYLEERLGPIDFGWSDRDSRARCQIARFKNQPEPNVDTYVTLGLSDEQLEMRRSGRKVRQELLLCVEAHWPERDAASVLLAIAEECTRSGAAILRGDVVELGQPISNESRITAVYATNPTVFGDKLLAIDSEQPPLVYVWLIPITEAEVDFIRASGWSAFEAALEVEDPDLWDMRRPSISTATRHQ